MLDVIQRECSSSTPTHWAFKNLLWVGAGTKNEWMNECLTTPQHENRSAIVCQKSRYQDMNPVPMNSEVNVLATAPSEVFRV